MTLSWNQFEKHVGASRLQLYVQHCGGDQAHAVELYRWNAQLAASFWFDLGHLEIALRNALDARMVERYTTRGLGSEWLDDPTQELGRDAYGPGRHKQPYKDIASARSRVQSNHKPSTHDQIISENSFGLRHQMVSRSQMFLWPDLAGAFPHAPNRAQRTVSDPVSRLRHFRNRIAHHPRIWALNGAARYQDILAVAGYIDPDLPGWIEKESTVQGLLSSQPC